MSKIPKSSIRKKQVKDGFFDGRFTPRQEELKTTYNRKTKVREDDEVPFISPIDLDTWVNGEELESIFNVLQAGFRPIYFSYLFGEYVLVYKSEEQAKEAYKHAFPMGWHYALGDEQINEEFLFKIDYSNIKKDITDLENLINY